MTTYTNVARLIAIVSASVASTAASAADTVSNDALLARWQTCAAKDLQTKPKAPLKPLGLYKDEKCTQPATADGDIVATFRDELTGHGLSFTQADPSKRALLKFVDNRPVLRFDGEDDHYLVETKVPLASLDFWARYRIYKASPNHGTAVLSGNAPPGQCNMPNGFRLTTQDYQRSVAQNIMQTVHVSSTKGRFKMSVDGLEIAEGECHTGTSTQLCLGAQLMPTPFAFIAMDLEAFVLGNDVSADQQALIDKQLGTRLDVPRIVCVGDSITDGTHGGFGLVATEEYPSQLQLLLPESFVVNSGSWGAGIGGMPSVDQFFSKGGTLIVFAGTNDLAGGRSPDAVADDIAAYCLARQKVGWRVFVGTTLPRSYGPPSKVPADFEANRQALNQKLRDNFRKFSSGLADFAADPRIGEPGDEKDLKYFSKDEVHTTAAGATVLSEVAFKAISAEK